MIKVCLPLSHLLETEIPKQLLAWADVLEYKRPGSRLINFDGPRVYHWGLGLVQEDFIPSFTKHGVGDFLQTSGVGLFSFDLGPACRRNLFNLPLSPTLAPDEIKKESAKALNHVRKSFSGPLAAENYNYYATGLYEHICRPDFIADFLSEFGLGLVLDLAHAAVSARNLKIDVKAYLKELPLDRTVEIHVSRPYFHPFTAVDAHDAPGHEEFDLLEFTLKQLPPNADVLVAIEYYEHLGLIVDKYRQLRTLVDAHNLNHQGPLSQQPVQGGYFV
jgi:uncharacterized protein (UPF0276 family)